MPSSPSPSAPASAPADDSGDEGTYSQRSREPGELSPSPPRRRPQSHPLPDESGPHSHGPSLDCELHSGTPGEFAATHAEASVASSEAHISHHWPPGEPDSNPALRWRSYSAGGREAAAQKPCGKCVGDPKGKLVINLSGSPRSLLNVTQAPLKTTASAHDQKSQTNSPNSCLSGIDVGAGLEPIDKVSDTPTDVAAVSENLQSRHPGVAVSQGTEGYNKPNVQHSIGDAAISELAKKFRLRVKRVRLPAKPNLFLKRDEDLEVNHLVKEKRCVDGSGGEPPVFKDVDAGVSNEEAMNIAAGDKLWPTECSKLGEARGNSYSEGMGRSEDGGTPAASLLVHNEVEAGHPPRSPRIANPTFSKEEDLPRVSDSSRRVNDIKNEVPSTSRGISMQNACASEAQSSQTRNSASLRLRNDEVNDNETLCRRMAPASTSSVFTDGSGSGKGRSVFRTISSEEATRATAAKEHKDCPTRGRHSIKEVGNCSSQSAPSMARRVSTSPDTSMLEIKEQTVLETLLPDEPPGYSSADASESSRSQEFLSEDECSQSEESENDDGEYSQSEDSENEETEDSESEDSEGADTEHLCKRLSPGTPGRGGYFTEQVPSVLCDAEGNVWHVGKRAEKARGNEECQAISPPGPPPVSSIPKEKLTPPQDNHCDEVHDCARKNHPDPESIPNSSIQLNWKWPSDADYTINSMADVNNRFVVVKERSIFVGCIPDGVENLEELLETLMEKFLDRFDFAPAVLSQIQVVKVLKDFAFVELATDKVAQIVLAANQLDVFEWGVNGYHFNIEGCNGTHTSVRPLIEYMALKPARAIFVGNIPKSHWEREYLETYFSSVLLSSDGPADLKVVLSVHLLPESCDAYVELASELMADALIYRCTKNPKLLKEIGEDVFICRDASSVPLMSRHPSSICPQRSLFVGVSHKAEDFKIDCVRKVLEEVILIITRKNEQRGYIEYISIQPGMDYAFFQFNSEAFTDALLDEYIENTQIFVCNSTPAPYIILRPPQYVRPGAKYYSGYNRRGQYGRSQSGYDHPQRSETQWRQTSRIDSNNDRVSHVPYQVPPRPRNIDLDEPANIGITPRKFGDEPGKKPDCVMSMGICPLPLATWNGLSSTAIDCSADPESMVIVEGLPKGLSYKLVRGALNELFERTLASTGLLEMGTLLLRYLDRDENFNIVACLPNARVVYALVSMRKVFIVAGNEIRLLPKDPRRFFNWRANSYEVPIGHGELSCVSDEEASQGRRPIRNGAGDWNSPRFFRERRRMHSETGGQYQFRRDAAGRGPITRRNEVDLFTPDWCQSDGLRSVSPPLRQEFRGNLKVTIQQRNWAKGQHRGWDSPHRKDNVSPGIPPEESPWPGNNSRVKMPQKNAGFFRFDNRSMKQPNEGGMKLKKRHLKDVVIRVPKDGIRKVQSMGPPPFMPDRGNPAVKGNGLKMPNRKRMRVEVGAEGPCRKVEVVPTRFRKHQWFEGNAGPRFL